MIGCDDGSRNSTPTANFIVVFATLLGCNQRPIKHLNELTFAQREKQREWIEANEDRFHNQQFVGLKKSDMEDELAFATGWSSHDGKTWYVWSHELYKFEDAPVTVVMVFNNRTNKVIECRVIKYES